MSDTQNPYESSTVQSEPFEESAPAGELSTLMLLYLQQASPWLRFMGIMGFLGAAVIAGIGLLSAFGLGIGSMFAETGPFGLALGLGVGLLYILMGILAFFPAKYTFQFGQKLRNYQQSGSGHDLEMAFRNNKSLWKFNGILTIVYMSVFPISILLMSAIGIFGALL